MPWNRESLLPRKGKHVAHTGWTEEDKRRAVVVWKACGNLSKTSELTGIPYNTIKQWSHRDWWREGLLSLKAEDSTMLEHATTNLAKQAADVVRERLSNGDFILDRDGVLVRKPVNGRDAAVIMGISMQKRKELMDEPVHKAQLGTHERLLKLVEQFVQFANSKEIKGTVEESKPPSILEAEIVKEENDNEIQS